MGSQYQPPNDAIVTRVIMMPLGLISTVHENESKYRQLLLEVAGIIDLEFDATGQIHISYDVNEIEYEDILLQLEKIGLPISYSLWEHMKAAWFQYVDAATRTKAEHGGSSDYHRREHSKHSSHKH